MADYQNQPPTNQKTNRFFDLLPIQLPITIVCGLLLALHLFLRYDGAKLNEGLDAIALGLVLVGLSPWIARIIDTTKFGGFEVKFSKMEDAVQYQQTEIDTIKFLIGHFLSRDEFSLLTKLASPDQYEIDVTAFPVQFQSELRHLRGLGFIDNFEGMGIAQMYKPDPQTSKRDVRKYFFVTASGRQFLKLRESFTDTQPSGTHGPG